MGHGDHDPFAPVTISLAPPMHVDSHWAGLAAFNRIRNKVLWGK
jgi:hypothetical protein